MSGSVPPLPNTPSWRGAKLKKKGKTGKNLPLPLPLPLPLLLPLLLYTIIYSSFAPHGA
jgi:hypothetical protein